MSESASKPTLLVVSDLHVSTAPLDDSDDELAGHFAAFLKEQSGRAGPLELVINGDFLDFVQATPWEGPDLSSTAADGTPLSFTEGQSVEKLGAIVARHPDVFRALGDFLGSGGDRTVTILPGNHDPDFYWPRVRESIKTTVAGSDASLRDRLRFYLDPVYRPAAHPAVWIEHGHRYDPVNAFAVGGVECWSAENPPVRPDLDGTPRLVECLGTRFLVRFLNRLDRDYPYVDNVKPFSRFVGLFLLSGFVRGQGPLRAAAGFWSLLKYVGATDRKDPNDLLSVSEDRGGGPLDWLRGWVQARSDAERLEVVGKAAALGVRISMPLDMYVEDPDRAAKLLDALAEHPEAMEGWPDPRADELGLGPTGADLGGAGDELSLAKGFGFDDTTELKKAARRAATDEGAALVLMGHTHQVVRPTDTLPYINTGCWTRYYRFDAIEPTVTWPMLKTPSYSLFPYQLNYVEVGPEDPKGRLITYRERSK